MDEAWTDPDFQPFAETTDERDPDDGPENESVDWDFDPDETPPDLDATLVEL